MGFMKDQDVGWILDGTIISHSCCDNGDAFHSVHSITKAFNSDSLSRVLQHNPMVLREGPCVCVGVSLYPSVLTVSVNRAATSMGVVLQCTLKNLF